MRSLHSLYPRTAFIFLFFLKLYFRLLRRAEFCPLRQITSDFNTDSYQSSLEQRVGTDHFSFPLTATGAMLEQITAVMWLLQGEEAAGSHTEQLQFRDLGLLSEI